MKDNLRVLAITSFPTVGNAGLKNMMSILGTNLLPVPTLLLSGLGFIEGHQRFESPLEDLLNETLNMAEQQEYSLVVYIGYLREPRQVDVILKAIENFEHLITTIIVDPVCGDNGQSYISQEIIDQFPKLLSKADWALPNETEVRILSQFDFSSKLFILQKGLIKRYPNIRLITTGIKSEETVSNHFLSTTSEHKITHAWVDKSFYGTGDAFAALFIFFHFLKKESINDTLNLSGEILSKIIELSASSESKELMIDASVLSDLLTIEINE